MGVKTGIISKIISSKRVELKKRNKPAFEVELELSANIGMFSHFLEADEPGGFTAKLFLCSFVRKSIKYSID